MDFTRYLRLVLRKSWIIVLLLVVALSSTFYFTQSQPPVYTTRATLVLNPSVPNSLVPYVYAGSDYIKGLAENYNLVMKSDKFATKIAEKLSFPISLINLKKSYSSSLAPNSLIYYISASSDTAQKAQEIANTVTTLFLSDGVDSGLSTTQDIVTLTVAKQREQLKALQADIDSLNGQITKLKAGSQTQDVVDQLAKLNQQLKDNLDVQSKLVVAISNVEGSNSKQTTKNSALLIDDAKLPVQAESNGLVQNLIFAGVLAVALSIGVIILLDYMDYSIKSGEELNKLTGIHTLAQVPLIKLEKQPIPNVAADASDPNKISTISPFLVTATDYKASASEAYRALRTNLLFSSMGDSQDSKIMMESFDKDGEEEVVKSFVVTSSLPGEGKSLTASNLAVAFAQVGRSVLLVDADMRQPTIHKLFGLPLEDGLSNLILPGQNQLPKIMKRTLVTNLSVITAGNLPPNPSELLTSARAAKVMDLLLTSADIVIYDSPPANLVSDASILANRVDRVIMVVGWGATRRDTIAKTVSGLRKVGARITGTVLNRVENKERDGYYYYSYGKYGYGYGNDNGQKKHRKETVRTGIKKS